MTGLALACGTRAARPDPAPETPVRTDIGDGIYLLSGRSNCAFAVGKDGVILFDTLSPGNGDAIKANISAVTQLPVLYVVNTHSHSDHTGSNLAFGANAIPIVAQEIAQKRMAMSGINARGQSVEPAPERARPTQTFADKQTLSIKGVSARLIYAPNGHMDNDLFAWLPKQNVMITGDLLQTDRYPSLDPLAGGTLAGNIRALRAMNLQSKDDTKFLPGHGPPIGKAEFRNYLEMVYRTVDEVAALVKQGKSAEEVVAAHLLADDTNVAPGGPDNRDAFIGVVYEAVKSGAWSAR